MARADDITQEWLLQPVTESAPCGPDLEAEGDDAFIDYYYEAEARLPERYVIPGMAGVQGSADRVFDPKSINLRAEAQAISALLRRSRDLRLLSLLARFQILAAKPAEFANTLEAMAALLAQWPDALHPVVSGSAAERRAALDELGSMKTVVMPLQYLHLTGQSDATYRRYLVASGQVSAREDEEDADRGALVSALASPAHQKVVENVHGDLARAALALSRISSLCSSHPTARFNPELGGALQAISGIQELIREARPELPLWSEQADGAVASGGTPADAPDAPDSTADEMVVAAPQAAVPVAAGAIADRGGVRAALEAAERYLAQNEPSSPALLLVTQARLLIGRPLIEALETLLPAEAAKAVIAFAPETGFAVSMERMKKLSESALGGFNQPEGENSSDKIQKVEFTTRAEVVANIRAIEEFYLRSEPASPIPILLAKARGFMDKGFQAIVAELVAKTPTKN